MAKKFYIKRYKRLPEAPKTKVKNVPESSKYKKPIGDSCIGYWEKQTKYEIKEDTTYYCPACGAKMSKKDSTLDGAHVFKPGAQDKWYFVPLCSSCNSSENNKEMEVDTIIVPVPPECYELKED